MALRDVLFRQSPDKDSGKAAPERSPKAKAASAAATAPRTGRATGKSAAKPTARRMAKSAGKPTAGSGAKPAGKSPGKAAGRTFGKRTAKPVAKPAAKPGPKSAGRSRTGDAAVTRGTGAAAGTAAGGRSRVRSTAKWWPGSSRSTAEPTAKRSTEPAAEPSADRAPTRRAPQAPLLQRRSAAALLARATVLAVAVVAMVAFAVALARVTLVPSPASDALVHTNLRPGASIRAYLDQPNLRDTVKQIGGNIVLGVPFGILLPALFPRARGLLRVVLFTALVMLLVETAQGMIVEGRAFDIDDVILNTFGALLGYLLIGRRLGRALHPRRVHWWHRLGYGTAPEPPEAR
jgi:VanZ like family